MDQNEDSPAKKSGKFHNVLPFHGNESTMNLNPLILANIQGSSYFKVHLFKLKTYHEVVDEIYYQVKHLEPWERGSRKTSGQTGMCGGVRGVGAGGIVSTAYCLLYKLYTLKLTRKQVNGLMTHTDSPYIRALGFMYIRYTQPPGDLFDWYEEYLQDEEDIDVKAGGGQVVTIGQMLYQWLTKLDWFSTLFPRIPVPIQKQIEKKLSDYCREYNYSFQARNPAPEVVPNRNTNREYADKGRDRYAAGSTSYQTTPASKSPSRDKYRESPSRDKYRESPSRDKYRDRYTRRASRSASREKYRGDRHSKRASRSSSREKYRGDRERGPRKSRERDYSNRYDQRNSKDKRRRSKEKEYRSSHAYRTNDKHSHDSYKGYSRERERDREQRYH